ncbi:MAG TPA: ABC transporter permease [Pseudacidobacterium sp.]|jgi:predicted permease|nr:ABC transporter permease [Pseudacidobacterium sp.]
MATLFWNDVKYALRQLWKTPGFTLTAVLTLALGIGVNAAMFSVIDQVLLRPLPYPNADRLVQMGSTPPSGSGFGPASLPDIKDWQARSHTFQGIGYFESQPVTLRTETNSYVTNQVMSSTNLFDLLGVRPSMGRNFTAEDGRAGKNNVIVIGTTVWQQYLHSDPNIIGKEVFINGDQYTVVGVLPPSIGFPGNTEAIYAPINVDDKDLAARDSSALASVGLLRPAVSVEQASTELNSIHEQLLKEYPKEESKDKLRVMLYRDTLTENVRPALFALYGAIIAVWLIACVNVAGLMLTRANSRRREIAIRGALGAGRNRLMQQFLTESLLLSLGGGIVGLGFAAIAPRLLKHYLENAVFYGNFIHINGAVCAFLLVASCLSALLFGLVPGWIAASTPVQEGLREGSAVAGVSKRQALWRDASVVAEITLTLALLIAAGLMMRTLFLLRHAEKGFVADNVVTGMLFMPTHGAWWNIPDPEKAPNLVQVFYRPLLEKLGATPGISFVGFTTVRPLMPNWNFVDGIVVNGRPRPNKAEEPNANARAVNDGYFKTFDIRILKGRFFGEEDTPHSPVAAVVNESFVKQIFPNEEPLGKQIEISDAPGPRHWATIVGVAEDVRQHSMSEAPGPELDLNLMQMNPRDDMYPILSMFMNIVVSTNLPPAESERAIRRAIREISPDIALQDFKSMPQVVDDSMGSQTLAARLLGIFGIAALAIAVAGIYGLLSYSVSQRTREFGVRLALGSPQSGVVWLVLRHALLLLCIGVAAGVAIAVAASGVMRAFTYGFHGYDVLTVMVVAVILAVCGLTASYIPARRAASVDPVVALRSE